MSTMLNLRELEKNSLRSTFQSGLVDIAIGLIFLVSSVCHIFDDIRYYLMPLYLLPVILLTLALKYVAVPRIGYVKPSKQRRRKNATFFGIITGILVLFLILTIFGKSTIFPDGLLARFYISAIILYIIFANAFFLNFPRLYLYGLVIVAAFNLNEHIRENHSGFFPDGGYAYLLVSIILFVTGMVYLVRFLKNNPLPKEGENHD